MNEQQISEMNELTAKELQSLAADDPGRYCQRAADIIRNRQRFIDGEAAMPKTPDEYQQTSALNHLSNFFQVVDEARKAGVISTGFSAFDGALGGGLYPGLYVIGAMSALGKTAFTLQIADQVAAAGRDVLIFTLEMSQDELIARTLSRYTCINALNDQRFEIALAKTTRQILTGNRHRGYTGREQGLIDKSIADYKTFSGHIFIIEGRGDVGAIRIRDGVQEHIRLTGRRPVVIVDYMQLLAPNDARSTDKQNADKAVMELKRISRDEKTPVIVISSYNRANYESDANMAAFKESGGIEYTADVLIGMQLAYVTDTERPAKTAASTAQAGYKKGLIAAKKSDPREVDIVIMKNRNAAADEMRRFKYYPRFNYFVEGEAASSDGQPLTDEVF